MQETRFFIQKTFVANVLPQIHSLPTPSLGGIHAEVAKDFNMIMPREKRLAAPKYRLATLKNRGGDLEKRWYIEFYIFSGAAQKPVRQQDFIPAIYRTADERNAYAAGRIPAINALLKSGHTINGKTEAPPPVPLVNPSPCGSHHDGMTVREGIEWALRFKKATLRKTSYDKYRDMRNLFYRYASEELLAKPVRLFSQDDARSLLQWVVLETEYERKDQVRMFLKSFWTVLAEEGIIAANPFPAIKTTRGKRTARRTSSKNKAFTEGQFKEIVSFLKREDPQLYVFVMAMFYTFARPNRELRLLLVGDVDLPRGKIRIVSETSKNGYERHTDISPHLLPLLQSLELDKHPASHHVFGNKGLPGPVPRGRNTFYNRFVRALAALGITDNDLTLYSVKHTGITRHYLAGIDPDALREQTGHRDWESFWVYLKSLNLIENDRFKSKSPDFS